MKPEPGDAPPERAPRWLLAIIFGLVLLPLLAAAAGQIALGSDYHATGDLADIELHTRDVGHRRVELGQYSRGDWSHPGPAQFYALAVPYRLTGSTTVSNNLGALLINALSIVGILVVARRRGGLPLFVTAAVGCALLIRGFGPAFMVEPWNPSMPVFPFGLFLFLVWDMMRGQAWATPAAAVVGTFCIQTHVGYIPLVIPLAALGSVGLGWTVWRARRSGAVVIDRRKLTWALGITVGALVLMWTPPVLQELRPGDGNLTRIAAYFVHARGEKHTLAEGYAAVAVQFGLRPEWITGNLKLTPFTSEPDLPGGAPLALMALPVALGAVVWWRRRSIAALQLIVVTAVATGVSVVAVSRTIGPIYHYRLGWTRLIAMMALASAVWALWVTVAERRPRLERRVLIPVALIGLAALSAVGVPRFARASPPLEEISDEVAEMAPEIMQQLPAGDGPVLLRCDGDQGCIHMAGLVLWFERHGVEAQVTDAEGVIASGADHRRYRGGPVRDVLHIAIGANFYAETAEPDAVVVTFVGDAPTPSRVRLAKEIVALDADYDAGTIDRSEYFFARGDRLDRLGHAVGVIREPYEP